MLKRYLSIQHCGLCGVTQDRAGKRDRVDRFAGKARGKRIPNRKCALGSRHGNEKINGTKVMAQAIERDDPKESPADLSQRFEDRLDSDKVNNKNQSGDTEGQTGDGHPTVPIFIAAVFFYLRLLIVW